MVDKILSPIGANELILKVNEVIDNIPVDVSQLNNDAGYITGISSSDIETALGYVPYSASNPDGFISSAALSSLTDTSLSNLANGQGLIYNSTTQKWENGTIATNISWGAITGTLTDQTDLATALNGKQNTIAGAASSITTSNLTGSRVLVSGTDGKVAASAITTTKLGYLTDVTSNIQAQIDEKADDSDVIKKDGGGTSQTIQLSSGTGTTPLVLKSKASSSCYMSYNANGTWVGSLGVNSSKRPTFYNGTTYTLAYTSDIPTVPTNVSAFDNDAGYITGITSSDVTTALGYTPYNSTNPAGYITASALSGYEQTTNKVTSITSSSTDTQYPSAKAVYTATNANATAISTINSKIPSQATSTNQLADKAFVNSSVATNTAYFIGTFNSVAELEAYSGTLTNNDYAFVVTEDTAGNTLYDRYKYNSSTSTWAFEYELNNSSFTAGQWAAINSGITSDSKVTRSSTAAVGNSTIPVYVNSSGVVTTCAALNTAAYVANNTLVHLAGAETITGNKTFSGSVSLGSSASATTPATSSNTTAVATTAFVKNQGYITSSSLPTVMTGATSSTAGASGLVPAPAAGDEAKFLKGDGTWAASSGGLQYAMVVTDYTGDA